MKTMRYLGALLLCVLSSLLLAALPAHAQIGNSLSLSGVNQHVTVPAAAANAVKTPFTVEAWVYVRSHANWSRLMDFCTSAGVNNIACVLSSSTSGQPALYFYDGSGAVAGTVTSPTALPLNTWTHLAFTANGTNGSILINGSVVASGPMPAAPTATRSNNFIGRSNFGSDAYANAIIDEFRIWSTARSPAQIQASMGAPLDGDEPYLHLYYKFDSASGTVATNSSLTGAGYNGTLVNGPGWVLGAGKVEAFNANLTGGTFATVVATAVQPDGKIIIGGNFTMVGTVARANLARLNADGSLDASFTPNLDKDVDSIAVQADGKILIGGDFTMVNGTARTRIARINADGTLDATFNPGTGATTSGNPIMAVVICIRVQPDGKILLGGYFTHINGTLRPRIARLNADGSLDATFVPSGPGGTAGLNFRVTGIAVQADGKIVVGGEFTTFNGAPRSRIARINADGSLDATFNPGTGANQAVECVALQADGKILLGGDFTNFNGTNLFRIARLYPDGSLESGATFSGAFAGGAGTVHCLALQADGKILVGGDFLGTPNRIARINTNGIPESTANFDPGSGPNSTVYGVALQADGKILLCGLFATPRQMLARLTNNPAPQTVSAPDHTQVLWTRGGSAPEVAPVTFELSTNGGAVWTPLGAGTRVGTTSNWRCTGLNLPPSGMLRARGRTTGGYGGGSSGLVETVGSFTLQGIEISQAGVVADAGSVSFGTVLAGTSGTQLTFSIHNTGSTPLTGLAVTKSGANSANFTVSALSATSIPAGAGPATFTVTLASTTGGLKSAALQVANNRAGSLNPYDLQLTGRVLSFTEDTDGDGLNDASEFTGTALGFDWQVSQPALVQTYSGMANGAGLYTTAQVQALHVDTPLISRDAATGKFKLTIGLEKATTFSPPDWLAFPFVGAATSINGQGKVEFQFTAPDNAAFYRLQAQ